MERCYHVSETLVEDRLHETGTPMRRYRGVYTGLTSERLRELYCGKGMSRRDIAAMTGYSEATVFWRLRTYGIPRRQKSGPRRFPSSGKVREQNIQ